MRPPLTRVELHIIRDRNRGDGDVEALLWEVARLRALVLRSHDYLRQPPSSATSLMMAEGLTRTLDAEPAVLEQPRLFVDGAYRTSRKMEE